MLSVWGQYLNDALANKYFSDEAHSGVESFDSCAIGERAEQLFGFCLMPDVKSRAYFAGMYFVDLVGDEAVEEAAELFKSIQKMTEKDWRE